MDEYLAICWVYGEDGRPDFLVGPDLDQLIDRVMDKWPERVEISSDFFNQVETGSITLYKVRRQKITFATEDRLS